MKNLETLKLKLKRHKIQFLYNENLNQIEIGKSLNKNQRLLWGVVLIPIGIILFSAPSILTDLGLRSSLLKKIFLIIPIGLIYFGGMEINKFLKLGKNNKRKIIRTDSIIIQETPIKKEQILDLDYFIESIDNTNEFTGSLFLTINNKAPNEQIILLTLYDKDHKYLKDDLNYLKTSIKKYMDI